MTEQYYTEKPEVEHDIKVINGFFFDKKFTFKTDAGVFSKNMVDFGSALLIQSFNIPEKGNILDLGCGYGPIGLTIASQLHSGRILFTDINERALDLVDENIQLNRQYVSSDVQLSVLKSRGFENINEYHFNYILLNPPIRAGKGTICKELLQRDPSIIVSVSATTRQPRNGEQDGISYHFLTRDRFENMIQNNGFLEHACVYNNYYGTPKDFVVEQISSGKNVLLEIDIQGALQVKKKYPEGVFVFILPPSMKTLKTRIEGRGSETPESLKTRLSSAVSEIELIRNYDYFIVNDTVNHATDILQAIITAEKCRVNADIEEIVCRFKEETNVKTVD